MGLFGRKEKSTVSTTKAVIGQSFKCPYCFEEIKQNEVCFLVKDTSSVDLYTDDELEFMDPEERDRIVEKQKVIKKYLPRTEDEILDRFWNEVGGKTAYQADGRYPDAEIRWNSPLVTPQNAADLTDNGYEKDEEGFISSVTDKYSHHKSEVRICPCCHNPIPVNYGKYPTHIISVIGIQNSGKTIYLKQLIGDLQKYLGEVGLDKYVQDVEADRFDKIDSTESIVPAGTTVEIIMPPITVTMKNGARLDTLVFYDIAGENCQDPNRMDKYGKFISHADGIIMLIDPNQFKTIAAENNEVTNMDITAVLNVMKESFLIDKQDANGKVNLPVAFVLSKSDYLVNSLARNPKWRDSLITKNVQTHNKKVNWADMLRVQKNVKEIIREFAPDSYLTDAVAQNFSNYMYLAVTSLGCATRKIFVNPNRAVAGYYQINSNSIEGDRKIFIDFQGNEETLKNHIMYYDLIKDADKTTYFSYQKGVGFTFNLLGLDKAVYDRHDTIQFQIDPEKKVAYEMVPPASDTSTEWVKGAQFSISMIPAHAPQPRRVEEPLHWLLSELKLAEKE